MHGIMSPCAMTRAVLQPTDGKDRPDALEDLDPANLPSTYRLSRSVPSNMLHDDPNPQNAPRRSQPYGRHPPLDRLRVVPIPGLRSMRMVLVVAMLVLVLMRVLMLVSVKLLKV